MKKTLLTIAGVLIFIFTHAQEVKFTVGCNERNETVVRFGIDENNIYEGVLPTGRFEIPEDLRLATPELFDLRSVGACYAAQMAICLAQPACNVIVGSNSWGQLSIFLNCLIGTLH
jgi:hypothetical protein